MKELYTDLNIRFSVEQRSFCALNIIYERFLRTVPSHSHGKNSYEIHYIPSGFGHARINQALYDIVPNTLYVTGPHVEHAQVPAPEDPMCEYCVYLNLERGRPRGNPEKRPAAQWLPAPPPSILQLFEETPFWFGQDRQNVSGVMEQIFFELRNQYRGYMQQVEALLTQLVVLTARNYEEQQKAVTHFGPSNPENSKFILLEEYFLYEYQNLSLKALADRLGLGCRQTERLLKEHYGKTFLQKKTEARMAAAAILLSDQARSISSIAEELGYSSAEHFSAAFKRHYKMTAREYRRRGDRLQK
ncbi:MAG: AraC family transcriptional regulator [Lachnospiraceae bacterium]|jgi:AraC family 4-hydroxyphenylacetate 3-monooxygenase operon regulatory protein|nr:AraC family transcriptional regulator [Lachnospiraceae bacterium]